MPHLSMNGHYWDAAVLPDVALTDLWDRFTLEYGQPPSVYGYHLAGLVLAHSQDIPEADSFFAIYSDLSTRQFYKRIPVGDLPITGVEQFEEKQHVPVTVFFSNELVIKKGKYPNHEISTIQRLQSNHLQTGLRIDPTQYPNTMPYLKRTGGRGIVLSASVVIDGVETLLDPDNDKCKHAFDPNAFTANRHKKDGDVSQ